jgi:hypothetical protein
MKRVVGGLALAGVLVTLAAPASEAAVNIERESHENPVVEVFRSTIYGGLAGLVVGGAIAWATESDDSGEIVKWGFVTGTFVGLAAGIAFAARRPQPTSLLELEDGTLRAHVLPTVEPLPGGARAHLVGLRF